MQLKPGSKFDLLDMKFDIPISREMGVMLGGGMVVYAEGCDIVDEAPACLEFYRNESCGKCVPCRLGSQKLVEMATDLKAGKIDAATIPADANHGPATGRNDAPHRHLRPGHRQPNPMTTLLTHYGDDVKRTIKAGAKTEL